jgi:ABC-2 type transport system permease protein
MSGAIVTGKPLVDNLSHLAVIAVWAIAGLVLAVRGFSWDARRE